jgi:outer membrane protein assembly factor BamB
MKFFSTFCLLVCVGLNLACSQLEKKTADLKEKISAQNLAQRHFLMERIWVRQTTQKPILSFRKLNRMTPVVYKNLVIAGNPHDGLVAYDQETGLLKWRRSIELGVEPSATLINDRLFVGANDGQFYSISAEDGNILWSFPTRIDVLSEPLLVDGVLYILTGNNALYALDAATGRQIWQYSRQDLTALTIRGGSRPVFKNGNIIVGFSDGFLVSLLANSGAVKWERQLSRNKKFRDVDADPVLDGDVLYISAFDEKTYAVRVATGDVVWTEDISGYGKPVLSGKQLIVATSSGEIVALEKDSGRKIWTYALPKEESGMGGFASVGGVYRGLLLAGESNGALLALDLATGKKIQHYTPGRGIFAPPRISESDNSVYFMSNESNLYKMRIGWAAQPIIPYLQ